MDLVFHPQTKQSLNAFCSKPSHAVMLVGEVGTGKATTAHYLANKLLGEDTFVTADKLYIVRPIDGASISIQDARGITNFLKLASPGTRNIRRVVIIEDAHAMTVEAQNAILKTLEEPAKDSVIILTTANRTSLLPTIVSRVSEINILPVSDEDALTVLLNKTDQANAQKALLMSNGRIGLACALVESDDHPLLPYIEKAKELVRANRYARMLMVDQLAKQDIPLLLDAIGIVSSAAFKQSLKQDNPEKTKLWHRIRKQAYGAQSNLKFNPNGKLLLSKLVLEM